MAKKTKKQSDESKADLSTTDALKPLRQPRFESPLDQITELLSMPKRAFVIGAGVSKCAGLPLMSELTEEVLRIINPDKTASSILESVTTNFDGSDGSTIEDYMSEIVDAISVSKRRENKSAKDAKIIIAGNSYSSEDLQSALSEIKRGIVKTIADKEPLLEHHRRFVQAVHGRLQLGKPSGLPSVDYFTLNYDTLLEDALAYERISTADGFSGGANGWWQVETFENQNVKARVFKIHGSIDWCQFEGDPMPRRLRRGAKNVNEAVLIWPAATKYREAQRDPYAQLLDKMRKALQPGQNSEVVVTILGYSFGDEHINLELDRALRESEGKLTFLVFTSSNEPLGLLADWLDDKSVREQVRIHANRGFFHGEQQILSNDDLPWWKFEVLVRILGGEQ